MGSARCRSRSSSPRTPRKWVDEYYELLASEECVPAGFAVNPTVAIVLPMMLARDEAEAIERGHRRRAVLRLRARATTTGASSTGRRHRHVAGVRAAARRAGFARQIVRPDRRRSASGCSRMASARCAARSAPPTQVTDLVRRYEAAGIDQIMFILQAGRNRHEHICESLRAVRGRGDARVRRGT